MTSMNDAQERKRRVALLNDSFQRISRDMEPRNWKRQSLYDRRA